MGLFRLLYDNKITDDEMISVSSLRYGLVSSALKEGTGSATMNPAGLYTGQADREYIVEIDSVAAGKEIGQATFKWSDGQGGWNATGVATAATAVALNNGVTVSFTAGTGDDFDLADKWYFKAFNLFNPGKMADMNRDARYRAKDLEAPNTVTVDLGAALEIQALILYDHNLTVSATITLAADSAATFDSGGGGAPEFSEAVSWTEEKILHYLATAQTYRYWQIQITDPANPVSYIEIGEIFLGPYLELTKNMSLGAETPIEYVIDQNVTPYGVKRRRFYNLRRTFAISIPGISESDVENILAMLSTINSRASGIAKPFFYNGDSAFPGDFWMVQISGIEKSRPLNDYYTLELEMEEVLKSV